MAATKKPRGLGRGLDTLLGDDVKAQPEKTQAAASVAPEIPSENIVVELELTQLKAGKYQPRTLIEQEKLSELAESIKQQGVISPIIVRRTANGRYEIIAGERRFRASKIAGRKTIPAIVRTVEDKDALAMALIENMQREDLNAMEEALGVKRLIDEFGYTHEQAADAIGRSRSGTTNLLRLLNLTDPVQQMLVDGKIDMGHARALLSLSGAEQIQAANEIVAKELSVREAEKLVAQAAAKPRTKNAKKPVKVNRDDQILEERLSESIGAPVHVVYGRKGKGQLVIDFANFDDLDALIARIAPDAKEEA
ncbi:MAG: ParB/RepB/Spo0J family partition protein [Duodenibacillus sp.]|nr:ParB/RepB/Spo0J family partition protein [Duodenibacillus sp.]